MNTTAQPNNSTTTTATNAAGQTVHTATLNTPPVTAAASVTMADKLRAKLNKSKAPADKSANPITPKVMFEQLDQPGTITSFIEAALNGEDKTPLVILASHVNRSECLKAAHAAIKFADLAAKYAPTYGLTAPEFTRLLTKLIIQDYNPASITEDSDTTAPDAPDAAAIVEAKQETAPITQETTAAPVSEPKQETGNIFGITEPTAPTAKPKKATHKA